jgi:hypothetical protein
VTRELQWFMIICVKAIKFKYAFRNWIVRTGCWRVWVAVFIECEHLAWIGDMGIFWQWFFFVYSFWPWDRQWWKNSKLLNMHSVHSMFTIYKPVIFVWGFLLLWVNAFLTRQWYLLSLAMPFEVYIFFFFFKIFDQFSISLSRTSNVSILMFLPRFSKSVDKNVNINFLGF